MIMTIRETIELINLELTRNVFGRRKIEITLPPETFLSFGKFIKFCIRYRADEPNKDMDISKLKKYNVRVNGRKVYFVKKKV